MKKKHKTYLLLAVVAVIWGVIIFKFIGVVNPATKQVETATNETIFVPKQIKERELFGLTLDYRDPFLGTVEAPKKKIEKAKKPPAPKKVVPKKSIQYTGFIQQKNANKLIFFVTIEGQQQMMKLKDTFQDVKLVKGTKSAIKIAYKGKVEKIELSK